MGISVLGFHEILFLVSRISLAKPKFTSYVKLTIYP